VDLAVLVVPLLAVLGVALWALHRYEQRHRDALLALAHEHGWSYTRRDDSWAHRFPGTPFGRGQQRRAHHVLRGRLGGREMVAFDYTFTTTTGTDGNGNGQTRTHRYAVCGLALPCVLPDLELTPENLLTRLGGALGLADVELESEDFNRRYRVACREPRFAYDVLHPRAMSALLARPTLHLAVRGDVALSWETGRTRPDDLRLRLEALTGLLDGIPSYVWKDRGVLDDDRPAEGAAS
jgi:hypothetical protein